MGQTDSSAAAIILAAGGSSRLGRPKQLLDWFGKSFIAAVVDTAIRAKLDPVIVVTGSDFDLIENELKNKGVIIVRNTGWEKGQSSSLIKGVEKLISITDKPFIFMLSDQPQVSKELLQSLMEDAFLSKEAIITTSVEGQPTPPILFKNECIKDLLLLKGDQGGRKLMNSYPTKKVESKDKGIIMDCDTDEDYNRIIKYYKMRVAN